MSIYIHNYGYELIAQCADKLIRLIYFGFEGHFVFQCRRCSFIKIKKKTLGDYQKGVDYVS